MVISEWFQVFDEAVDSAINGRTDSNPFHDVGQLSGAGIRARFGICYIKPVVLSDEQAAGTSELGPDIK